MNNKMSFEISPNKMDKNVIDHLKNTYYNKNQNFSGNKIIQT